MIEVQHLEEFRHLEESVSNMLEGYAKEVRAKVLVSGAAGMAEVIYNEILINTSGFLASGAPGAPPGIKTRNLHNAVYRAYSPERSNDEQQVYHASVNKRKAPHWYLVEFGTYLNAPHPYLRPALDHMDAAINEGLKRMKTRAAAEGLSA